MKFTRGQFYTRYLSPNIPNLYWKFLIKDLIQFSQLTYTFKHRYDGTFLYGILEIMRISECFANPEWGIPIQSGILMFITHHVMSLQPDWASSDFQPPPLWPSQGEVEFRNYSATYRPQLPPVLRQISLQVRAGEKVGSSFFTSSLPKH